MQGISLNGMKNEVTLREALRKGLNHGKGASCVKRDSGEATLNESWVDSNLQTNNGKEFTRLYEGFYFL